MKDIETQIFKTLIEEAKSNQIPYNMENHPKYKDSGLLVETPREYAIILNIIQEENNFPEEWFQRKFNHETLHYREFMNQYHQGQPSPKKSSKEKPHLGIRYITDKEGYQNVECFFLPTKTATNPYKLAKIALAPETPSTSDHELAKAAGQKIYNKLIKRKEASIKNPKVKNIIIGF